MNRSFQGFSNNKVDGLNSPRKATTLNPNAAEFIPQGPRSISRNTNRADATGLDFRVAIGKPVLDRSESSVSGNSDDEAHQYWCSQLPDDITPDFKVMGENELHAPEKLSLADLSINDAVETPTFSTSVTKQLLDKQQNVYSHGNGNLRLSEQMVVPSFAHAENQRAFHMDLKKDTSMKHLDFLALKFPGFPAESLARVYCANGRDMNLTIEILTEMQFQSNGNLQQYLKSKGLVTPGVSMLDFTAIPAPDAQNGLSRYEEAEFQLACIAHKTPTKISRGVIDNPVAVRELTLDDPGPWKYERNGSAGGTSSSSGSSPLLGNSYGGHQKPVYGNKLQNLDMLCTASVRPETGRVPATISLGPREESRDFAPLQRVCFEQAREAYLRGDKARARELIAKGQLLGMYMKADHQKALENVYHGRNFASHELQGNSHSQVRPIDLSGLHTTEAIRVLEYELSLLRGTVKPAGQRLSAMIYVGTGHQTKGLSTPGKLVTAVKQYLLEEGLHHVQPQPGQFHVVIY